MNSKNLSILLLMILSFATISAQALEPWSGEKYIHSVTKEGAYYIKVNMLNEAIGQVVMREGKSLFDYSSNESDELVLTMTGDISRQGFVYQVNEKLCSQTGDSIDCSPQQYPASDSLKAITLSGFDRDVVVKETWERCVEFPLGGVTPANDVVCESNSRNIDGNMISEDLPTSQPIEVVAADKIVVSTPGISSIYLQLNVITRGRCLIQVGMLTTL